MFTLNPGLSSVELGRLKAVASRLPQHINKIRRFEIGEDLGLVEGNADLVVVAEFDNEQDYIAYADHPAHRGFVSDVLKPCLVSRTAVQYRR
jgi:hypothetical protein